MDLESVGWRWTMRNGHGKAEDTYTGDILYIGPTSFKIVNSIENITESI